MPDDACSAVKEDLEAAKDAGSFTNYTDPFPIYIENKDYFQGGNVYIGLIDPTREPVQTVDGSVLYYKRGCTVVIVGDTDTARDNLFKDVVNILTATGRGYKLKRGKDKMFNRERFALPLEVSMLL